MVAGTARVDLSGRRCDEHRVALSILASLEMSSDVKDRLAKAVSDALNDKHSGTAWKSSRIA